MELLQRAIDSVFACIRDARLWRAHGFTIVFAASAAVIARLVTSSGALTDFTDRPIGMAATQAVSSAARTGLFAQSIVLFLAVVALTIWLVVKVERAIGAQALRVIEALSMTGLAMFLLVAHRVVSPTSWIVLFEAFVLVVVLAWFDQKSKRTEITDRGSYTAWILATSFATLPVVYGVLGKRMPAGDWVAPGVIVAGALALELARRSFSARDTEEARARISDRFVYALTPLATLAAWSVLQNEIYFLLNHNGVLWLRPYRIGQGIVALVAIWILVRAVRGPRVRENGRLDIHRELGFFTFPWIVAGITAMLGFTATIEPTPDFLEPANAGLFVQQWHDFGRVPFIETFSSHGLHDSFFGFVYSALNGLDASWQLYDYLFGVLAVLVAYHVLRAVLGHACAALFCIFSLPYLEILFPSYASPIAVSVFVVAWVLKRRTAGAWAVFTAWCAFAFLWRLDIGFANAIASFGALAATIALVPEYRPPTSAIVRGCAGALLVFVVLFFSVCAARHVDAFRLLTDFRSIVSSNQAFAYPTYAYEKTDIVLMHMFVLPVVVALTLAFVLVRLRGKIDFGSQRWFVAITIAFLATYYFANYPRGLVRHSFMERGNTMLSSFGFLALSIASSLYLGEKRRLLAFGGFLLVSGALCLDLDPSSPERKPTPKRTNRLERAVLGLATFERSPYSPQRVDRSPAPPWFAPNNTERIVPFLESELDRDQTFLDLSNSPMLFYHAHRVTPHYVNHTLLVFGDAMQRRFIEDLGRYEVPIVVHSMQSEAGKKDGMPLHVALDGVPYSLRHYRLREWVQDHYEPFVTLQRFQIWMRKDRLTKSAPSGTDAVRLCAWKPNDPETRPSSGADPLLLRVAPGPAIAVGPRPALRSDRAVFVRFVGRSDTKSSLQLSWNVRGAHGTLEHDERRFEIPAGTTERFFTLPRSSSAVSLLDLAVEAGPEYRLEALELVALTSSDALLAISGAERFSTTNLGEIAALWDEQETTHMVPTVLCELVGKDFEALRAETPIVDVDDDRFLHGVGRDRSSVLVDESKVRSAAAFQVGDHVLTARGEVRTIVGFGAPDSGTSNADRRELFLDGALLDPVHDGAPGLVRLSMRAAVANTDDRLRSTNRISVGRTRLFSFTPLESRAGGTELALRVRSVSPAPGRVVVVYGAGAERKGEFTFTLRDDDSAHEYVVRLSSQYNWKRHACDWITVTAESGDVDVERAVLRVGD